MWINSFEKEKVEISLGNRRSLPAMKANILLFNSVSWFQRKFNRKFTAVSRNIFPSMSLSSQKDKTLHRKEITSWCKKVILYIYQIINMI